MSEGIEKLESDLTILEAMAAEMADYLMSDVLFWPMLRGDLPRLTLGGYHLRQYRLVSLRKLLGPAELVRLDQAVEQYNEALVEKVVRFEQRAHSELEARLRQWREYLRDARKEANAGYYATAVDTRAMIAALLDKLQLPPYQLDPAISGQLNLLDRNLRKQWHPADFVWPDAWQPAYPQGLYWWLYGYPR